MWKAIIIIVVLAGVVISASKIIVDRDILGNKKDKNKKDR